MNKLAVTREEEGGDNREKGGRVVKEHIKRTHGQSQRGIGLRVGGGGGCRGGNEKKIK